MIKKRSIFATIFLIGIVFFKSGKSFAYWNDKFTFTSTNGDVITIYKNQSSCDPKGTVEIETGTYGTKRKSFYISAICIFKGISQTYGGLKYKYETSANCDNNEFICKAAGQFGLLNNYWSKYEIVKNKLEKEVSIFNKDYELKERLAKKRIEKTKRKENLISIVENWRKECQKKIKYGKQTDAPLNSCFWYAAFENKLSGSGFELSKPSIIHQIPEELLVARVDRLGYSPHPISGIANRQWVIQFNDDARNNQTNGIFINCFENTGYGRKYGEYGERVSQQQVFCGFTNQTIPEPSRECIEMFLTMTYSAKKFICKGNSFL